MDNPTEISPPSWSYTATRHVGKISLKKGDKLTKGVKLCTQIALLFLSSPAPDDLQAFCFNFFPTHPKGSENSNTLCTGLLLGWPHFFRMGCPASVMKLFHRILKMS